MANRPVTIIAVALVLVAAGAGGYLGWRSSVAAPIVGVVRVTEIRVAPEVSGQLTSIKVRMGDRVRAGSYQDQSDRDNGYGSVSHAPVSA